MSLTTKNYFAEVLLAREQEITRQWLELQTSVGKRVSPAEQQADTQKAHEFIRSLQSAVQSGELANIMSPSWDSVREILSELSANRARNGYTPTETATFVFSLKGPITSAIRDELGKDAETLGAALTDTTDLLDKLGLFTFEQQFPIAHPLHGLLFFDAGNVWDQRSEINPRELRVGAGFGFRMEIPLLGNIGFDYGYGFHRDDRPRWAGHFMLGNVNY